jgi:hypothetical protein
MVNARSLEIAALFKAAVDMSVSGADEIESCSI